MMGSPDFVINTIRQYWKPGSKILEIGCGPAFLGQVFKEDYIGIDITTEPYGQIPRNVDIVCMARNLALKTESIDIIVIKSALYLFNDVRLALEEAKRVVKKEGLLLLFDYNKRTQKILCKKEGHKRYPCWTQWKLKKILSNIGFLNSKLLLPVNEQPIGFKRVLNLLRQEVFGTWAIVVAQK